MNPVESPGLQNPSRSADPASAARTPRVLREYSLIADGERGGLIGPAGDIVWLCAPRWDSDAIFNTLVGGGGHYTVTPADRHVWGGFYEEGSLIWRSRWVTDHDRIECREALALPADTHTTIVLRRVAPADTKASIRIELDPRGRYGVTPMTNLRLDQGVWTARVGPIHLRWQGAPGARPHDDATRLKAAVDIDARAHHDLVLEISDRPLPRELPDAEHLWRSTESGWRETVPAFDGVLDPNDTRHHYAVLRGLTSSRGGTVAAATTSLPERADAGRNYDYRYVWIRDQCYTGRAVAAVGALPLLDDAVAFVADRLLDDGEHMAPAYTTGGGPVPDERHLDLPGYPGGHDVIGNRVNKQFQLDAFGEALLLFSAAARYDRLDTSHWEAAQAAAAAIDARWQEPDAGIWEIDKRPWTHSRLIAAAGLKAIAAAAPPSATTSGWLTLADKIVAHTTEHALHRAGHWQRSPDDPGLDAALLLPALRGGIPADDPRSITTLRHYLHDLTRDGFAYRFRHDSRPLNDAEGSFLLCGFLAALALDQQDDRVEARAWYERTRAACGPPQLFSEEYDVNQHQMRGNLPQAFVHALAVEAAASLGSAD